MHGHTVERRGLRLHRHYLFERDVMHLAFHVTHVDEG